MDLKTRQGIVASLAKQYRRAAKKDKGWLLDEFIRLTGYNRIYAAVLLSHPPKKRRKQQRRHRKSVYRKILPSLRHLWVISDASCGKRFVPMIPGLVDALERHGEIKLAETEKRLLVSISPATVDRLLTPARKRIRLKGRSTTKPGSRLKSQIPIRIFTDWNDQQPGFLEIDLVAHCGEDISGEYINSLDATDIVTHWTECAAFIGRSRWFATQAIDRIEERLPFPLLGIDSDNDAVFINVHLIWYCRENKLTFTRCRPYRKNDQAHVEQRNNSVVRKYAEYQRLETPEQLKLLNRMYQLLSLYRNFFQATMKLKKKQRFGSRVKRVYEKPAKTPYQRVLEYRRLSIEQKQQLNKKYLSLNPAELLRQIRKLQEQLFGY